MATQWSDHIVVAQLADEPSLSEELGNLGERIASAGESGQTVPHAVLDFSAVSYINSSNIAQLLQLSRNLTKHGRTMRLCALSDEVWSVMMITGLEKVFRFALDTMTALASIQLEDGEPAEDVSDGEPE